MGLVSPNIALFVFGGIIILSAIAAWYFSAYAAFDRGRFHVFIVVLAGLGVTVTFLFYYNVVQLQNQEQQLTLLQQMTHIDDILGKTLPAVLREITPLVPAFVLSLYPLHPAVAIPDYTTPEAQIAITTTCATIFYLWQDVILTHDVLHHDMLGYTVTFLQWAHSPILAQEWAHMLTNLSPKTQIYGRLLFQYGANVSPNSSAYQEAAEALLSDPAYQEALC